MYFKKKQEKILKNVESKITEEDKQNLDEEITAEEVVRAINKMPQGKSPGLDGFPVEFYKKYWKKYTYFLWITSMKLRP